MKKKLLSMICAICAVCMLFPMNVYALKIENRGITGGTYNDSEIILKSVTVTGGTFNGNVLENNENCYIKGGIFNLDVHNYKRAYIQGGTFNNTVYNDGQISGGIFKGTVHNMLSSFSGQISGGTFYGAVNNSFGTISNGAFYGSVNNNNGTITGGTFYGEIDGGTVSGVTYRRIVTFDSNGGSSVDQQDVVKGEKATQPADPTKQDYLFDGWYYGDTLYDFSQPVNDNITLQAHWKTDTEIPHISGLTSGKYYCDKIVQFTVTDNVGVASVTANGVELTADADGYYTLEKGIGGVTVIAKDYAGNTAQIYVILKSAHIDLNRDHVCDNCREYVSDHDDTNNDHNCDYCGKQISICRDKNNDHLCDVCSKELTTCQDKNNDHLCDKCEKKISEHTGGNATCTNKGICDICKEEYFANHSLIKTEAKDATCTENGNLAYWTCSTCHKLYSDENGTTETTLEAVTIQAGHSLVKIEAKDVTCTEDGNIEYWTCSKCDKLFLDENGTSETTLEAVTIQASGHSLEKIEAKEATCTENGNLDYWKCSKCNKLFLDENGTDETTMEDVTIQSGHSLVKIEAKDATCTENGNLAYWICSTCDKLYSDENGTSETTLEAVTIQAGHSLEKIEAKNATCTEDGNIEYWTCSTCHKLYSDENGTAETTLEAVTIQAGHSLVKTEAKEATCTEDGNLAYWTCSKCDKLFLDENGTSETTLEAVTIQALDHSLKKIDEIEATETETGIKEYFQCDDCHKYFSDEEAENEIVDLESWKTSEGLIQKLEPQIIEGTEQSVAQGTNTELSFRSNALFKDFICVKLDGKILNSNYYTVKSGSIVVTLNSDFVSTLKAGKHTISIVSESGEATTEFEVVKKEAVKDTSKKDNSNKTNTGLIENAGLWISMMVSSLDALFIGFILHKKKK